MMLNVAPFLTGVVALDEYIISFIRGDSSHPAQQLVDLYDCDNFYDRQVALESSNERFIHLAILELVDMVKNSLCSLTFT